MSFAHQSSAFSSVANQGYGSQAYGSQVSQAYGSQANNQASFSGQASQAYASQPSQQLRQQSLSTNFAQQSISRQSGSYGAQQQQQQQQQQGTCGGPRGCNPPVQQQAQAAAYESAIERAVIQAKQPIESQEREQITAGQFTGTLLNRQEIQQFRGPIPLEQYRINDDQNPEVVRKRIEKVRYQQEVAVRYLNPPQPQKPGDLIIREKQSQIPPAPPVVLRQEGDRSQTPYVFYFISIYIYS
jgi:hypothetical protein